MEWVKITSIKTIKKKQKVYNFSVPKYKSYLANGFVVHNCYVNRHREYGNPLTTYSNISAILEETRKHWLSLPKKAPNQCDPVHITYDIAEASEALSPAVIETTKEVISYFIENMQEGGQSPAKPTFATKLSRGHLLNPVPKGKARVRISLMPQKVSSIVEVGTSKIISRIESANELYRLGYELHLNLSPVIIYNNWHLDYIELFKLVDRILLPEVKEQLAAEVIFLTYSPVSHEMNMKWNEEGESYLWVPSLQEYKTNERGDSKVLRYKALTVKKMGIKIFRDLISEYLPYCQVRYIF